MKISLNTIKFVNQHFGSAGDPAPDGVDALVQKIGAQLGAVEEVVAYGKQFEGAFIAKVVSCQKHPNADKLQVCIIDDNNAVSDVSRDDNGRVQVVCGAPNVREGLLVTWLPPGATVPSTFSKDSFVLEAREIRGQISNGMLASPHELGISDDHSGILEVDVDVAPGTSFTEAYNLAGETLIDIENKMFTHRPDCFGFLGVAREIEGIHKRPYKSPDWYVLEPEFPAIEDDQLPLQVINELPELVPRFTAVTMRNVTVKPSPVWLQILLSQMGIRSINNIVDYTNYFMLQTGQPLHAYDYDKVKALDEGAEQATITVRNPKEGEKITLLGGKEVAPRKEAIMIATATKPIGIGGVMGGAETEVDDQTKNIILECANFDMYSIRRTSMGHGLFTDAVTRFTKGQSPLQNRAVLAKIVDEIRQYADGKVASEVIDDNHVPTEVQERGSLHASVTTTAPFINVRLGLELSAEDMAALLRNVEFGVEVDNDNLTIAAPFWRTDIRIPEDIVEEVGRLYGYDHLPVVLPKRSIEPAQRDNLLELKSRIRNLLSRGGANEVLTYSFVHGDLLDKVGQDREIAFRLTNALSPELQYYRVSLTPSLLEKVHPNIKAGTGRFVIFEMGKAHVKGEPDPYEPSVPKEVSALSLVFAADEKVARSYEGAPYYQALVYLDQLLERGTSHPVKLETLEGADLYNNPWMEQLTAPYEPKRSAVLRAENGLIWGVIGEFKTSVQRALKLPVFTAGFELDPLLFLGAQQNPYTPLSRFPKVEQDICLEVSPNINYQELFALVWNKLEEVKPKDTTFSLDPVDIYQKDESTKRITLRLTISSYERTLMAGEVNNLLDQVAKEAKDTLKAHRI